MNHNSRTYKSLKNSAVSLSFYAFTFVLSFLSRRIFLQHLGPDVLGLNTTASSLLGFLNLAELGIGTAIAVTLYKPLQEKDNDRIREIVSLQGWFYRRIAWLIIAGSVLLFCFFPLIFKNSGLPLWYSYAAYSVLLFSSLLGYFFNYKQIVLSANQQQYLIHFSYTGIQITKTIVQMMAVSWLPYPFVCWLALEFLFSILFTVVLNYQVKKAFPALEPDIREGKTLKDQYKEVIIKVKQVFVHKISTFALTQTSPVIIYAYASLSMVTSYGNYLVLSRGLSSALNAMFNSMGAGVGNLVAEGDRNRILSVFRELFSSRFLLISVMSYCLYVLSPSFICLWIGQQYILDNVTVFLVAALFFIMTSREVVDSFINAYGLFHDVWAPVVEASLNVGCSILFGKFWGLPGILGGVLVSQVLIILIWKPYFLFRRGFEEPFSVYLGLYLKHVAFFLIMIVFITWLLQYVPIDPFRGMGHFVLYASIVTLMSILTMGLMLWLGEKGMRSFVERCLSLLH
ncbi:MAG: sugar transporter [Bacteroidales bacterium]|nr:sugar transporter [Bacteroidales bacterium]